jgi:hypothetical protein
LALHPDLRANVTHAFAHEAPCDFGDGFRRLASRVAINGHAGATLPTEQLIERHPGAFALDVPERGIDSAEGVHEHGTVAPIRTLIHRLPEVLDVVRVFADEERSQVFVRRQ